VGSTSAKKEARIGYDYLHSVVDDHSRLAYSEIHHDERGNTAAGFVGRAATFFADHGISSIERIMTDYHWSYTKSHAVAATIRCTPQTAKRAAALAPWLNTCNNHRRHHALAGHPPSPDVTNLTAEYN
jgi:hypothetical protein